MIIDEINNLFPGPNYKIRHNKTRAYIRYRLYRKRSELESGTVYDMGNEIPDYFEEQEYFMGWKNFAILWDVRYVDNERWEAYRRVFTEDEEWNAVLRARTTVLPMRRKKANKVTDE